MSFGSSSSSSSSNSNSPRSPSSESLEALLKKCMSPETFAKYEQDIHLEDEELLGFEKGKIRIAIK